MSDAVQTAARKTYDRVRANSFWLAEALDLEGIGGFSNAYQPLDGDAACDICIVGGGFCGLWTAIRLKEHDPSLSIIVLEKDVCGAGASGRNGGFMLSWWAKLLTLMKVCGAAEGLRLAWASSEAVDEIGRFCETNGIDCQLRKSGWLWAATNSAQVGAWAGTIEVAERYQAYPFQQWTTDEVAARSGSDRHIAGVFESAAASVQPAMLARGLARVARQMGVRICEGTPMSRLDRGRQPKVVTDRGVVSAGKIVLTMNAWAIGLPEIRPAILVVSSDIVGSSADPERLREIGWDDGMNISDGRMLVHYYRTTTSGRIAFGKGGMSGVMPFGGAVGRMYDGPSRLAQAVEDWFRWTYPNLREMKIASSWSGPIDRSKSGLPHFGALEGYPDILYGVGFSGNGVGPTSIGGRILASLALERDDEWARCGLVRPLAREFPREPIRYVGGQIVRRAVAAKDRAEDAGRAPSGLTTYLASLAPAGLSPTKGQKPGIGAGAT